MRLFFLETCRSLTPANFLVILGSAGQFRCSQEVPEKTTRPSTYFKIILENTLLIFKFAQCQVRQI